MPGAVVFMKPEGLTFNFQGSGSGKHNFKRAFPTRLVPLTSKDAYEHTVTNLNVPDVHWNVCLVSAVSCFHLLKYKPVNAC